MSGARGPWTINPGERAEGGATSSGPNTFLFPVDGDWDWGPSNPPKKRRCEDFSPRDSSRDHLIEAWQYSRRKHYEFRHYYAGFGDAECWMSQSPETKGRNLRHVHGYVFSWAREFALRPEECADLTSSQKRTIIASLEGQVLQEDWDTLHKLCPSHMAHSFHIFFVEALVAKDIYDKVIENPFWFFDGKLNEQDEGQDEFGDRLHYLFKRFARTNEIRAGAWLTETMRLASSVRPLQAHNLELGQHHEARRNEAAIGFAKSMLESEPLQFLLKKLKTPEHVEGRFIGLVAAYREAAKRITDNIQLRQGVPQILRSIKEVGETYSDTSPFAEMHGLNIRPEKDWDLDALNGRRILLVTYPCVLSRMPVLFEPGTIADRKAVVIVEDPDEESENNPQASYSPVQWFF